MVSEAQLAMGAQYSLDEYDVSGRGLLDVGVSELDGVGSGNSAVPELVGGLLYLQLLEGPELGVAGQKGELSVDSVFHAFF